MYLKKLSVLGGSVMLAGCLTAPTPSTGTRIACSVFKPIFYSSKADSKATVDQIKDHNLAYGTTCLQPKRVP